MSIKKLAVLGVCGVFLASVALDQVKYTAFTRIGTAESGDVDGVGKIKLKNGTLDVHVNVSGLSANTAYSLYVSGGDIEITFFNQLTTDNGGHINFHGEAPLDIGLSGSETLTLFVDADGEFDMDEGEKRARSGS
jgi:hypothetical protein